MKECLQNIGIEQWRAEARKTGEGGRLNRSTLSENLIRTLEPSDQEKIRNGATIAIGANGTVSTLSLESTSRIERTQVLDALRLNGKPTQVTHRTYEKGTSVVDPESQGKYADLYGLVSTPRISTIVEQNPQGLCISRGQMVNPSEAYRLFSRLPEKYRREIVSGETTIEVIPMEKTHIVVTNLPQLAK